MRQRKDGPLMDAGFEDFLALAQDRLDRGALAVSDGAKIGPATCAALAGATRSLLTLSTRYGSTPHGTPATAWQPAFVEHLTAAHRTFQRHTRAGAAPTPADELIDSAARMLTAAQDLLATHLTTPDPPRSFARTPHGEHLLDALVRDQLLRRAAELAHHLATLTHTVAAFDDLVRERPHLADAYRPRDRELAQAAAGLTAAATLSPAPASARLDLPAAPVMAQPISLPPLHEDPAEAAEQARHGVQRLATAAYQAAHPLRTGEHPPVHTARNLRASAAGLALAHTLASDLITRLTPHLPPAPGWNPGEAISHLAAAGTAWAQLREPWAQSVSIPDSGPRSPLTVQAHSIAIRLGRLLYAHPAWSPHDGPGRPRALGDLLDSSALDAVCLALSALPRAAATIAANHSRLIADRRLDLHSTDRAYRPEGEARRFYPLQPAQRAELAAGYHAAAHASTNAANTLTPLGRGYQTLRAATLMQATHPRPIPGTPEPTGYRRRRSTQPPATPSHPGNERTASR